MVICDRCGKRLKRGDAMLLEIYPWNRCGQGQEEMSAAELCQSCAGIVRRVIQQALQKDEDLDGLNKETEIQAAPGRKPRAKRTEKKASVPEDGDPVPNSEPENPEKETAKPSANKPGKSAKDKELDIEKIMALHRQKKSAREIAEELGEDYGEVAKAIRWQKAREKAGDIPTTTS